MNRILIVVLALALAARAMDYRDGAGNHDCISFMESCR